MNEQQTRKPTHPGAILRHDYLEPLGLTVSGLALHLGVSRKHLSAILNERAGVSIDLALRLARAFDTTPDLWQNLQRNRDLWEANAMPSGWQSVTPVPRAPEA